MRRHSFFLASVLAVQAISPVYAASPIASEPLRLASVLAQARQRNPALLASKKRWESSRARIPQATGLPAPKIGVEFEEIPRGTVKVNQATVMYQLIQMIPFPGKLSLKHQIAVKEAQIAGVAYQQEEWDVASHVKTTYYDLFLVDRELEIQQEQALWLRQASTTAQARYATGAASKSDVLMAQQDTLAAENQLAVLQSRRASLAAHLNHLINQPPSAPVGLPAPLALMPLTVTPDELIAMARERQPELLAFKYTAERAESAWKLSKRELLPDLETMVELRDPAMGPIGPWDLSLAVVLPFWFWTKLQYGVKVALRDKESAVAAYQAMGNEIGQRIYEHWHEAYAASRTAALSRDGLIPLSQQAVASAMAAYQSQRGSFADVLAALRALGERRREYAQELVSFEQHVVMLEQASGVDLRGEGGTSQ